MNAGIAAFRAGQHPNILMVFEVGTASLMAAKGAYVPMYQLMKDAGQKFNPKGFVSAVSGYYTLQTVKCYLCLITLQHLFFGLIKI